MPPIGVVKCKNIIKNIHLGFMQRLIGPKMCSLSLQGVKETFDDSIIISTSGFTVTEDNVMSLSHGLQGIHVLEPAISIYGQPQSIIVDNGPEFRSKALCEWACKHGIILKFIDPGKPTQNAYVESFNGKFRDECLNQYWFSSCQEAKAVIAKWRDDHNHHRPHSSLKYLSPQAFIDQFANNACQNQTRILI